MERRIGEKVVHFAIRNKTARFFFLFFSLLSISFSMVTGTFLYLFSPFDRCIWFCPSFSFYYVLLIFPRTLPSIWLEWLAVAGCSDYLDFSMIRMTCFERSCFSILFFYSIYNWIDVRKQRESHQLRLEVYFCNHDLQVGHSRIVSFILWFLLGSSRYEP
jgi:hypothetical protein